MVAIFIAGVTFGSKVPAVVAPGGTGLTFGVATGGPTTGTRESSTKGVGVIIPSDVPIPVSSTAASVAKFIGSPSENSIEKARRLRNKRKNVLTLGLYRCRLSRRRRRRYRTIRVPRFLRRLLRRVRALLTYRRSLLRIRRMVPLVRLARAS